MENNNVASATKDELETTKLRVESLSSQLQQYQKDVRPENMNVLVLHGVFNIMLIFGLGQRFQLCDSNAFKLSGRCCASSSKHPGRTGSDTCYAKIEVF